MKRVWSAAVIVSAVMLGGWAGAQTKNPITQLGNGIQKLGTRAIDEMTFTDEEERQIGADVSARLRVKYGVVQDASIHKYVSLVGSLVAGISDRPKLKWTFIVLDTDGINAFAAPGGFIHITRGALGLIRNEAELACVLGHEIFHVTAKHTLTAIRNGKFEGALGKGATIVTRNDFLQKVADRTYELVFENAPSAGQEEASDKAGIELANWSGYAPSGLSAFLARLEDRNKDLVARSGLWASHPVTTKRIEAMKEQIVDDKLDKVALVTARYTQSVRYRSVAVSHVGQAPAPSTTEAKVEPAKTGGMGKFGLGGLGALGKQKSTNGTIAATGSRGVNPDRDAKGGPNKALIVVTVTAAEITAFKKGIAG